MDDAIRSGDVLHSSSPVSGYTSSHCALCTRGTQEDGKLIHGRWSSHVPHVCLILPRPIFYSYSLLRRLSFPYLHTERVTTKCSSSSSSSSSSFSSSPSFQLILIFFYIYCILFYLCIYFASAFVLLLQSYTEFSAITC